MMRHRLETEAAILDHQAREKMRAGDPFCARDLVVELSEGGLSANDASERSVHYALQRLQGWGVVLQGPKRGRHAGWILEMPISDFVDEVVELADTLRFDAMSDDDWNIVRDAAEARKEGRRWSRNEVRQVAFRLVGGGARRRTDFQQIAVTPMARDRIGIVSETEEERSRRDDWAMEVVLRGERVGFTGLLKQYLVADIAPITSVTYRDDMSLAC